MMIANAATTRRMLCAAACLAATVQATGATEATEATTGARPQVEHWENAAGVPVYFVHVSELPMADIHLRFTRSGSAHEDKKYGLASMTAGMLYQGAAGMDVDEIADTFSGLGARSGASVGMDSSQTSLRSLTEPRYFDEALATWIKVFSSPDFPAEQFERRRKNVLTSIAAKRQEPAAIASDAFYKAVYGDHPYGHPEEGTGKTVAALTRNDLRRFHRKHYVNANLIITMVGALSREQAGDIAERISAALKSGKPAEALAPAPELKEAITLRIPFPSEQAHVKVGQPLRIETGHPDYHALRLGNDIFGGTGFGSRLPEEIRVKRGLAYSVGSGLAVPISTGFFVASFQTRLDQADDAIATTREALREFVDAGPTEDEIELALSRIRGGVVFTANSNKRILSTVSSIVFRQLGIDYFYNYVAEYEKENRESVAAAWQKHLHPDKMVTVVVGGTAESGAESGVKSNK